MEIKAELIKPFTDEQRIKFIVEYNHKLGYVIKETETELLALSKSEEEIKQEEQERIAMLSLTAADVERGIYKATGKDFDDVVALVKYLSAGEMDFETGKIINKGTDIDLKALKIELKANNFYRGNPYVDAVGSLLGFTKEQLDLFFETNDYTKLIG